MSAPSLPVGARLLAACGPAGGPQRSLHVLADGAVLLTEGEKIVARIDPAETEQLAIDVVCGDARAATKPGALLSIALALIAGGILRTPSAHVSGALTQASGKAPPAPADGKPASEAAPARAVPPRGPSQESLFACTSCGG